jgi:hypothetical protein
VRKQGVCCGGPAGIAHFDLSYWAFEKLAHPMFGRMVGCLVGWVGGLGWQGRHAPVHGASRPLAENPLWCPPTPTLSSTHLPPNPPNPPQMLEYRPVDCDTAAAVAPGYVNRGAIYKGGAQEGWGWFVYKGSFFKHTVPGGRASAHPLWGIAAQQEERAERTVLCGAAVSPARRRE